VTDTPVILGADGYPLRYGTVYRFVAIVPESAMSALNLGGPTQDNLRAAALRVGWSPELTQFHWPDDPPIPGWPAMKTMDDFVIRGEGTWGSSNKLPVQTPLEEFGTWMGWINVWEHTELAKAGPTRPGSTPSPQTPAAASRPRPSPRPTSDSLEPTRRARKKKKASPWVPWIVLGGLAGSAWLLWKVNQRPAASEEREEKTNDDG
jgi:hypothetical protein